MREVDLTRILGRDQPWRNSLGATPERFLREPKAIANGQEFQRETAFTTADIEFLTANIAEPIGLTAALIERKQPRWLAGWRDITNATNERTVIASVFPICGVGNKMPLINPPLDISPNSVAVLVAYLSSLAFDYIARQKIGGANLNYFILKQLPSIAPSSFGADEIALIATRVLELTFTSQAMRPWARIWATRARRSPGMRTAEPKPAQN